MNPDEVPGHFKPAVWVPVSDDLGLDAGWWPWRLPDRNPMPFVTVSPRLERALARWDDTRRRVRVAVAVLRHGCEYEDHLDCGDRW